MDGSGNIKRLLEGAGVGQYAALFRELGIDSVTFPLLRLQDLYSLGVESVGDRQRMLQLIKESRAATEHAVGQATDAPAAAVQLRHAQQPATRAADVARAKMPSKPAAQKGARIKVCVRKRPLNTKEQRREERDIVKVVDGVVCLHGPKERVDLTKFVEKHQFRFDEAFDETMSNAEIYQLTAAPLVESVFEGTNVTCFAYGQTGAGKTFTMMGPANDDGRSPNSGLITLAACDLFKRLRGEPALSLHCSFFEIYSGKLFDLLNDRRPLLAQEDGKQNVVIVGVKEKQVASVDELLALVDYGNRVRSTGVTGANADSSRSHAVIRLRLMKAPEGRKKDGTKNKTRTQVSKFSFIDLAGSERGRDTAGNNQQTRLEGAEINKSLLALKECIRAMDLDSSHLPFRGSKLTQVLKDSFVGDSRTVMIANIAPNSGAAEHSLNTLRYSDRVKELKATGKGSKVAQAAAYAAPAALRAKESVKLQLDDSRLELDDSTDASGGDFAAAGGASAAMLAAAAQRGAGKGRDLPAEMQLEADPAALLAGRQLGSMPRGLGGRPGNTGPFGDEPPFPEPAQMEAEWRGAGGDEQPLAASMTAHELLVDNILALQDELVEAHRAQIDEVMVSCHGIAGIWVAFFSRYQISLRTGPRQVRGRSAPGHRAAWRGDRRLRRQLGGSAGRQDGGDLGLAPQAFAVPRQAAGGRDAQREPASLTASAGCWAVICNGVIVFPRYG